MSGIIVSFLHLLSLVIFLVLSYTLITGTATLNNYERGIFMEHQIDWSATAAWIALAISIISPAVTTILTNRHQLKLRKLDIQEKHTSTYNAARASTIEDFISKVGKCISHPTTTTCKECAESFFHIYAYTPQSLWPFLDELNDRIESDDWTEARELFNGIAKSLACLLKGEPLILPSE